ncbi:hypothetical protein WJX72_006462 [[Myrmecia] bisecta]|uniref:DNA polymerase n=1 Tax=[Myrmecia] bisecta TaxID=41462 RepID=A0AAW1PNW0_9CHLO
MADASRPRRNAGAKPVSKAKNALAELAELRRTGGKRANQYEVAEEEAVYDEVDEEDYALLVSKRREEGGGFIEDDNGLGYADIGEEEDWGAAGEGSPEERHSADNPKKRKDPSKGKGAGKKQKKAEEAPGARQQMQRMFAVAAAKPRQKAAENVNSDALLDDILGDLGGSSNDRPPVQRPHPVAATAKSRLPSRMAGPSQFTARPTATPKNVRFQAGAKRPQRPAYDLDMLDGAANHEDDAYERDNNDGDDGCGLGEDMHQDQDQDQDREESEPGRHGDVAVKVEDGRHDAQVKAEEPAGPSRLSLGTGEGTPAAGQAPAKAYNKTPWKTPPPVFAAPATPATAPPTAALPASGWQDILTESGEVQEGMEEAAPEKPWEDDGTLPTDAEGSLPFFFIDAHEEPAAPGTVYLFGKVPHEEQHLSCCAVVRGALRNLFFVPVPGTLPTNDPELVNLEAAAAADPTKKGDLFRHLHERAQRLKDEVRSLLTSYGISQKIIIKPVKRSYAFDQPGVPHGEQYVLKVKYPAAGPQLPLGLTGKHFVAVFGTNQSALEGILLKRRIMGPSWISLKQPSRVDAAQQQVSWCKLEVEVKEPKHIVTSPEAQSRDAPPLVVAALNIKTYSNPRVAHANEIVAASVVYLNQVKIDAPMPKEAYGAHALRHFSIVRKLDGQPFPHGEPGQPCFEEVAKKANESYEGRRLKKERNINMLSLLDKEHHLLNNLLTSLRHLDADVLVGHNIAAFDLDILLHRMQHHKINQWSRIGRLKRKTMPSLAGGGHSFGGGASNGVMTALAGRLLCDTYLAARENVKEVDYTLGTLSRSLLKQERCELAASDVPARYATADKLGSLLKHAESDAWLSLGLAFFLNVLPLTRQLTNLSGSLWSKALQGQRAQRIEMLLLHEFHNRKFMLPDKVSQREKDKLAKQRVTEDGEEMEAEEGPAGLKRKAQYAGGLVLEPKKGLYDQFVLLLDFNSLYPSIIREYGICFTTSERLKDGMDALLPGADDDSAVLPSVLKTLIQRRQEVKKLLKDERNPTRKQQLDIRQQALKLTANSMYGCLGFTHSRFYAKPLAEAITLKGRELLANTVKTVEDTLGLQVVYGDTDSVMVNSGTTVLKDAIILGRRIKEAVNKTHSKLELELDGIFKCMLLLKKKKYAAVKFELKGDQVVGEVIEQKGLDIVRRDWCPLSKDIGNRALKEILSGKPKEEVAAAICESLIEVAGRMKAGQVEGRKYIITKQLTKRPEDYPDAKNQPHVQVALRRIAANKKDGVMAGQTVPYIICIERGEDGKPLAHGKGLAERAYHPDEMKENPKLAVDVEYYLTQQLHPVISRLCAPIEGADPGRLAECLGLDPTRFRGAGGATSAAEAREDALLASAASLDDEKRYEGCEPLWLMGTNGTRFKFAGVGELIKGTIAADTALLPPDAVGAGVGEETHPLSAAQLANQVTMRAREFVATYYDGWLQADELPISTRDVHLLNQHPRPNLDVPEYVKPGTLHPGLKVTQEGKFQGEMSRTFTEAALYTQLSYFHRLLDAEAAMRTLGSEEACAAARQKLAPVQASLDAGVAAIEKLRNQCAYRWVSLTDLYGVTARIV